MKIGAVIDQIIFEAINDSKSKSIKNKLYKNSLDEEEKQIKLSSKNDSSDDEKKDDTSKTISSETEEDKDPTLDNIIDRLNFIRSGRSFNDEEIRKKFQEYIDSLSKTERIALYAYLKGISQIVTGDVSPNDAADPKTSNVKMTNVNALKSKSIKPTIVKDPISSDKLEKVKSHEEDTTGPIKVARR